MLASRLSGYLTFLMTHAINIIAQGDPINIEKGHMNSVEGDLVKYLINCPTT